MNYETLASVMRSLAIEAGAKIMEIYDSPDFDVQSKSDDSPVTAADLAADAIISAGLKDVFPDVALVTEEVNIAYVVDGVPVRGIVYAPAKQRLFYTDADGQSVEETGDFSLTTVGETAPISVSNPDNSALLVVASKSHRDQATDDYINKYAVADMKSAGSSLKFCLIATGEADIYPRVGRTMEWDTAALQYGKPTFANPFFIAYAPGVELKMP